MVAAILDWCSYLGGLFIFFLVAFWVADNILTGLLSNRRH